MDWQTLKEKASRRIQFRQDIKHPYKHPYGLADT